MKLEGIWKMKREGIWMMKNQKEIFERKKKDNDSAEGIALLSKLAIWFFSM